MGRWWNRILLLLIVGLTAFSVWAIWPSEPDRYLPDAIPWPEGKGIKFSFPWFEDGNFGLSSIERQAMSLGLDLRGGTRLVLAPEEGFTAGEGDLDGAQRVIERRVNALGLAESEVTRLGNDRISVQLPGIEPEEAKEKIGRTALLQFCQPIINDAGNVDIVRDGTVQYEAQTCQAVSDADGNITIEGGTVESVAWPFTDPDITTDQIVWEPAAAELDGVEQVLDGKLLRDDTFVSQDPILGTPALQFQWKGDGPDISEAVTTRLVERNYPLAVFLDGEPIRSTEDDRIIAPRVQAVLTTGGSITGLSRSEAQELSTLLNTGAFPIPLRVVQQQSVDATLGETAVRNSVIAGEIALLLIMVFMVLYYRVPGLMASLALIVYVSFVLAIFKLLPVTLTLAGVAAFILSVGIAVDANILIFERMKEELRLGRSLIVALEDGFNRAWSAIRDSNISTLITCAILYWFGNQFDESAIKGFAITLAIGVGVSMFSAITVTRTFMRLIIGIRPIARRPGLFVPDLPEGLRGEAHQAPAVAGGAEDR